MTSGERTERTSLLELNPRARILIPLFLVILAASFTVARPEKEREPSAEGLPSDPASRDGALLGAAARGGLPADEGFERDR